jgi:hypothetical protein
MTLAAYPIFAGYAPKQGSLSATVLLDYIAGAAVSSKDIDLYVEEANGVLDFVQSAFIDNTNNQFPLVITVDITGQRLFVPALKQGTFPILAPAGAKLHCATTLPAVGTVRVTMQLLNVMVPYGCWGV